MTNDNKPTDAPAGYKTPQRPGQSGEQDERRAGPSPLSSNPTGPHAPYEADDPEGLAAAKHVRAPEQQTKPKAEKTPSGNFSVIGKDS